MARHQLLLVNNGIHITESVFGYQTIIMTHSNQTFHNQEIMDIQMGWTTITKFTTTI